MPEGADPMDLRYNVIQWVHRATRGWSYGEGIIDPRTGEIIKGQVSLGSLRVRQDFLIAEGLLAPYEKGKPVVAEDAGDGAGAVAAAGGARSGAHARARAQLFGEHGWAIVGDGLSAAGGDAGRGRRAGFVAGVCDGNRRVGQSVDHVGVFGFSGGRGRARGA